MTLNEKAYIRFSNSVEGFTPEQLQTFLGSSNYKKVFKVPTYADIPIDADTTAFYFVETPTGIWGINRMSRGYYEWNGNTENAWVYSGISDIESMVNAYTHDVLRSGQNLSDLTSKSVARTNLEVYSKDEIDSKVDPIRTDYGSHNTNYVTVFNNSLI